MINTATECDWTQEKMFTPSTTYNEDIQAVLASAAPPLNKGFSASEEELMNACLEANKLNAAAMLSAIDSLNTRSF